MEDCSEDYIRAEMEVSKFMRMVKEDLNRPLMVPGLRNDSTTELEKKYSDMPHIVLMICEIKTHFRKLGESTENNLKSDCMKDRVLRAKGQLHKVIDDFLLRYNILNIESDDNEEQIASSSIPSSSFQNSALENAESNSHYERSGNIARDSDEDEFIVVDVLSDEEQQLKAPTLSNEGSGSPVGSKKPDNVSLFFPPQGYLNVPPKNKTNKINLSQKEGPKRKVPRISETKK